MAGSADPNPAYWAEYSNLQRVKHDLIRHYLNGWFPKLGLWSGRVLYFDTHAGRGRHAGGQLGSPLVALETLLKHSSRDKVLQRSDAVFYFIERDEENLAALKREIEAFGPLPSQVVVRTIAADCFEALNELISHLRQEKSQMAPAFLFVDPYGFKVPGRLLRELMQFKRVELFVNIIWRELDMAIAQGHQPGMAETLDLVFDSLDWRTRVVAADHDERAAQAVSLLRERIGAQWATYARMLGDNRATRYLLLHLTNHPEGRDLMKDCLWKVCPAGDFYVWKGTNPHQQFLISPEPNLDDLHHWVLESLRNGPKRWKQLIEDLRAEIWRSPHLTQVLRELRHERLIESDGKFTQRANPHLSIAQRHSNLGES